MTSVSRLGRQSVIVVIVGAGLVSIFAWLLAGPSAATGMIVGSIASGAYAKSYISSHFGNERRESMFEASVVRSGAMRIAFVAMLGALAYLGGRLFFDKAFLISVFIGFAITFGLCLALALKHLFQNPRREVSDGGG